MLCCFFNEYFILGVSFGIGVVIVFEFVKNGVKLVLVVRNVERLNEVVS